MGLLVGACERRQSLCGTTRLTVHRRAHALSRVLTIHMINEERAVREGGGIELCIDILG